MPSAALDPPSGPPPREEGLVFVLRCRREPAAGPHPSGPGAAGLRTPVRVHFHLQEVRSEQSWRLTALDDVIRILRERIAPLSRAEEP